MKAANDRHDPMAGPFVPISPAWVIAAVLAVVACGIVTWLAFGGAR